jgi:hypothetical protein
MSNNKQSSVNHLIAEIKRRVAIIQSEPQTMARELMIDNLAIDLEQYEAMHEEELNVAYGNGYEQGEMDFYKKMQCKGDKYADGYSEGYKRALELVKHKIDNDLQGGNNE